MNQQIPKPISACKSSSFSRRSLLSMSLSLALGLTLGGPLSIASEDVPSPETLLVNRFHALAVFLTNKNDVPVGMTKRAYEVLSLSVPDFALHADQLVKAIRERGFADINAFSQADLSSHPRLKRTAQEIISALYLGRVGNTLVSFQGALMFRPTIKTTIVPTFSRGGPEYWTHSPTTLSSD